MNKDTPTSHFGEMSCVQSDADPDILLFPVTVIERTTTEYTKQSKRSMEIMQATSLTQNYGGPRRFSKARLPFISHYYCIMPSPLTLYAVRSLVNSPHYQYKQSEWTEALSTMRKGGSGKRKVIIVDANSNYQDEFLLVMNVFPQDIYGIVHSQQRIKLVRMVRESGTVDGSRLNRRIDTGISCGQNTERDGDDCGVAKPRPRGRSHEQEFKDSMMTMTLLADAVCDFFGWERCYTVDGVHKRWAEQFGIGNKVQAVRNAVSTSDEAFGPHEDRHNDDRPLMSQVFVLAETTQWDGICARHLTIAYSRKSVTESEER